ncbi:hypothetical protein F5Y16DRAFT_9285 [Xylariaceae sp. FL0255]|nr:hypothetical protein F5Y16DRAFT_9285 [Xylariaceae sp. FL0255]
MSFLNTSAKVTNRSVIPSPVTKEAAVALLHNHEFFILCDPHYASHKLLPQPAETAKDPTSVELAKKHFKLPATFTPLASTATYRDGPVVKVYEICDHMPNPVWSSNVVSNEEFVDHADGIWVRIRSPMGVVMDTMWSIQVDASGSGGGKMELVEDVVINCSRLVMGIVKGQVDNNWPGIHGKLIEKLTKDAAEGAPAAA